MRNEKMERLSRTSGMLGCEVHNYILIKSSIAINQYKCSKCGDILRLNKTNACCECINKCKGKIKAIVDKGIYQKCSGFNNGKKED